MIAKGYWPNGKIYRIEYINKDDTFYHRLNGPAYQVFYKDGFTHAVEYWKNGDFHSINQPAQVIFGFKHKIESIFYIIKDKDQKTRLKWKNNIKKII